MGRAAAVRVVVALLTLGPSSAFARNSSAGELYAAGLETFTIDAVSVDGEARSLDTWLWYPAVPGTGHEGGRGFEGAEVAAGRFAVIALSHGVCALPDNYSIYARGLAESGFVVVATTHPGSHAGDCDRPGGLTDSFRNRVREVQAGVDWILAQARDPASRYFGRIATRRIGVTGHSFGGQTVLRALALDPRFLAGVALQPVDMPGIRVRRPLMVVGAGLDVVTPFETTSRSAFSVADGPRFLIEILGGNHCASSDFVCSSSQAEISVEESNALTLRFAVPFFSRYLDRDASALRLLTASSAPAGAPIREAFAVGRGVRRR